MIKNRLIRTLVLFLFEIILVSASLFAQNSTDSTKTIINNTTGNDSTEAAKDTLMSPFAKPLENKRIVKYVGYTHKFASALPQYFLTEELNAAVTHTDSANVTGHHLNAIVQKFSVSIKSESKNDKRNLYVVETPESKIVSSAFLTGIPIIQSIIAAKTHLADSTDKSIGYFREQTWEHFSDNAYVYISLIGDNIHAVKKDSSNVNFFIKDDDKKITPVTINFHGISTKILQGELLYQRNIELIFKRITSKGDILSQADLKLFLELKNKNISSDNVAYETLYSSNLLNYQQN